MVKRGIGPKFLVRGANECREGCRELGRFSAVCLCVLIGSGFQWIQVRIDVMCCDASYGMPCFPFISQGKAWVIVDGKEENEKEKKSSRIVGSFFSFMRVSLTL